MIDFSALFSPSSTGAFTEVFSEASIGMLIGSFIAGLGIGAVYFGGLWVTVHSMSVTQQPALLFIVSFAARTVLSIAAIYWIIDGSVVQALVCVGGFLVMRTVMIQRWGPSQQGAQQARGNLWKQSA